LEGSIEKIREELLAQNRIITAQTFRKEKLEKRLRDLKSSLDDNDSAFAAQVKRDLERAVGVPRPETQEGTWKDLEAIVPADERIPPEQYELVCRANDENAKNVATKEILIEEHSLALEALRMRVVMLYHRLEDERKQNNFDRLDLEDRMEVERAELEAQEDYIREALDALNFDNARLRKLLAQASVGK